MDANNFVMSSYQFVNSLASCYPNNTNTNSTTGNAPQNDYFPGSAYASNIYPGGPQPHYPSAQSYNPLASGNGQQPGATDMVDYTQLQPQKFMLNQQQQQAALSQSSGCKYGGEVPGGTGTPSINQTSISSPQDLSTARDISPKLSPSSVVDSVRSLNKQAASQQHSTNNNNNSIANNNSKTNNTNSNASSNNSHLQSTSLPMRSPDGDESDASDDDSGTEGGSGTGSGKKPPQIYPWMKRVHLGTSKWHTVDIILHETILHCNLSRMWQSCHMSVEASVQMKIWN